MWKLLVFCGLFICGIALIFVVHENIHKYQCESFGGTAKIRYFPHIPENRLALGVTICSGLDKNNANKLINISKYVEIATIVVLAAYTWMYPSYYNFSRWIDG